MNKARKCGLAGASFARSNHGGVAIIAAVTLPLLIGLIFGAIDLSRALSGRQVLQDSLDAAALFAARSQAVDDAGLQAIGEKAMLANMINMRDGQLLSVTFKIGNNGQKVIATAEGKVPTTVLGLIGKPELTFGTSSEVMRSSKNVEVSLVLDTTGSMLGQNIADMKVAASDLIDIVVRDAQTPFYSKVALVPYSMAVNVGPYADQARGVTSGVRVITGATKNNPILITSNGHGFVNGQQIYIENVKGMTQLNDKYYTVDYKTVNTFALKNIDGTSGYSTFQTGGTGGAYCISVGCSLYRFNNPSGNVRLFEITNCVTERTGGNAYNDVPPSTTLFGRNYRPRDSDCLQNTITPLSSDKSALKSSLSILTAEGSTGGHIGVAWGWYMLSPNFGYLWPSGSGGASYASSDTIKAVVIMTDGEYNSVYCNGVISRDSTSGSGSATDHESCNAPNGDAYAQSQSLCTSMKNSGVIVYVVGFQVVNTQKARDLVANCASGPSYVYLPANGTDLKTAFRAIAQDLSRLRISK